jgi:hypothetical protein
VVDRYHVQPTLLVVAQRDPDERLVFAVALLFKGLDLAAFANHWRDLRLLELTL